MSSKIIFIFLDGVGMGLPNEQNPFWIAPMHFLRSLIGKPFVNNILIEKPNILLKGIDACLGIKGIPQSATGQTALFTGINASKVLGYHLTAYPNEPLKKIINESNILKRALQMGFNATFANAYDITIYNKLVKEGKIMHSATTLSVLGAELPFRTIEDLKNGAAVYWDITNLTLLQRGYSNLTAVKPETAGERLANLIKVHNYDFVLYECFLPDILGHRKQMNESLLFLDTLDKFFSGLVKAMDQNITVVMSSDHGNIEDLSVGSHTCNPVPLLVIGEKAQSFKQAESITDIADIILNIL